MKKLKIAFVFITTSLMAPLAFATCGYGGTELPPNATVCFGSNASNMTVHTCEGANFVNNGTKCSCADNSPTYDYEGYVGCAAVPGYTTAINEQPNSYAVNKFNGFYALLRNSAASQ